MADWPCEWARRWSAYLPETDVRVQYLNNVESRPIRVEGFLAKVKRSGTEGVNCNLRDRTDLHIDLVDNETEDPWFSAVISQWTESKLCQHSSYSGHYGNKPF